MIIDTDQLDVCLSFSNEICSGSQFEQNHSHPQWDVSQNHQYCGLTAEEIIKFWWDQDLCSMLMLSGFGKFHLCVSVSLTHFWGLPSGWECSRIGASGPPMLAALWSGSCTPANTRQMFENANMCQTFENAFWRKVKQRKSWDSQFKSCLFLNLYFGFHPPFSHRQFLRSFEQKCSPSQLLDHLKVIVLGYFTFKFFFVMFYYFYNVGKFKN